MISGPQVHAAHADAWEREGRARRHVGGGTVRFRDARLMASGLPDARWNNVDITGASPEFVAIEGWYAQRGVPWGLRAPVDRPLAFGSPLFVKRCFGLLAGTFLPEPIDAARLLVHRASPGERQRYVATEAVVFGDPIELVRRWVTPVFGRAGFGHWLAEVDGQPVAVAATVASSGEAGPAVMLTGLGSLDGAPIEALRLLAGTAIGAAAAADPATLVHVHAGEDEEDDIALYRRLGFHEVAGLQVRSGSRPSASEDPVGPAR